MLQSRGENYFGLAINLLVLLVVSVFLNHQIEPTDHGEHPKNQEGKDR